MLDRQQDKRSYRRWRTYSAEILPRLQSLLSALADIDFAYESDLQAVRDSIINEDLKTITAGNLRQLHQKRRAEIARQITVVQSRTRSAA